MPFVGTTPKWWFHRHEILSQISSPTSLVHHQLAVLDFLCALHQKNKKGGEILSGKIKQKYNPELFLQAILFVLIDMFIIIKLFSVCSFSLAFAILPLKAARCGIVNLERVWYLRFYIGQALTRSRAVKWLYWHGTHLSFRANNRSEPSRWAGVRPTLNRNVFFWKTSIRHALAIKLCAPRHSSLRQALDRCWESRSDPHLSTSERWIVMDWSESPSSPLNPRSFSVCGIEGDESIAWVERKQGKKGKTNTLDEVEVLFGGFCSLMCNPPLNPPGHLRAITFAQLSMARRSLEDTRGQKAVRTEIF